LGGAKIVEVFRVKNHDFTKKKITFFQILGGARAGCAPLNLPLHKGHDLNTNVDFSDFIFVKIYSKFDVRKQKLSLNHKKIKAGNLTENHAKIIK
jgi:hypothetical protein